MMRANGIPPITYVLPIKAIVPNTTPDFRAYLDWLSAHAEIIVVDGSTPDVFGEHDKSWGATVRHVVPDLDLMTEMGKVGGVLTGVRLASHERIIIADDDIRYDPESLLSVASALDEFDVVRPQNFFFPSPWHARWDTGRTLLNRVLDGDWPGTLGVRRSILRATHGYDGSVMFENLELVRTVIAAGGKEAVRPGVYVRRLPSTVSHFWSQRVRQAYDEFARPFRLVIQLSILPAAFFLWLWHPWLLAAVVMLVIGMAEIGRIKSGGRKFFPADASLFAVLWLGERAVCSWLAVGSRVFLGGVRYKGTLLRRAATSPGVLRERHAHARQLRNSLTSDPAALRQSA